MFWLGAILPFLNCLSFGLIAYFHVTARALTGPGLLVFLALSFALGALCQLRPLFRGLAVALSFSSMLAVGQSFGWTSLASYNLPAGLLYNSAIQSAAMAIVILALVAAKDWLYIPAMLPGLWLAQSRGGYLVIAGGLVGRFLGWKAVIWVMLAAAAVTLTINNVSDGERLLIWRVAWQNLEWFGHGAGSFANLLFESDGAVRYPGHVHNDYLQLAYELGVWAIPIYLIYLAALALTEETYWPAFAGFAVCGLFFFPLYTPVTAFIGAVLAGHLVCYDIKLWVVKGEALVET